MDARGDREGRGGQGGTVTSNPVASPQSTELSTELPAELSAYPIYTDWINRYPSVQNNSSGSLSSIASTTDRWLVIGTTDTFFLVVPTLEIGVGELASLETLLRSDSKLLDPSKSDVRYLIIDWRSISAGDRVARSNFETSIRDAVLKLEQSGRISRVAWDFLSGDAECYSVVPAAK